MKRLILALMLIPLQVHAQPAEVPTPAQKADKAMRSSDGTLVRVVGAAFDRNAAVTKDTDVGDVVEVQTVNSQVLCNVVIYAAEIDKSEFYNDAELIGTLPNVAELDFADGVRGIHLMWGTCEAGICAWNLLLRGQECAKVGALPHYVASTMKEMWDLPSVRARLLVTDGMCAGESCTVPAGDPRAIPGSAIRFPHRWSGRYGDLDFRIRHKSKYLERKHPGKLMEEIRSIGVGGPP